jgi:hypothetical protein
VECEKFTGSLVTVSKELTEYKVRFRPEVIWEAGSIEPARKYPFFYRKGNENHEIGT